MNPTIQPGMHPDAESLAAFAEQLLPAAEREQILAHMSACGRCREVVFLAQQAAEGDRTAAATAGDAPIKPRTSWFSWRWAWIPAAACAGLIGVVGVQHHRHAATETQTAANVTSADALRATERPKEERQSPDAQNEPIPSKRTKVSGVVAKREIAPQTLRRDEAKMLDEKKPTDQKDLAPGSASRAMVLTPGVAGGSIHGTMAARAKTSSIGGPSAANQFQQQNAANQQNTLQQAQSVQLDAANNAVGAADAPRSASETVTVQAESAAPAPPAASAPQPQANVIPTTKQDDAVPLAGFAGISKKQKASLPSGLEALSEASDAGRTLALDTKGALFLSEDGGKHWKPVRTQWTGRALLVRGVSAADKGVALKISPTVKFELVTDDLQTWVSADGNIWTLQNMSGK